MRIALLSDIHGNLEALMACLADANARKADRYVFLGDIVGYGADPVACLDHVREVALRGAIVVRGNHDEAVVKTDFRLNRSAQLAVDWTRSRLSADQSQYLASLPLTAMDAAIEGGCLYVHASAAMPARFPYVQTVENAQASFAATTAAITFAGHVHVPALYHQSATGKSAGFTPVSNVATPLSLRRRWLAILGAVGQPRDGNPAAAYAMFDTATSEITNVRVAYDIDRAAAKIRSAGLPDSLWKRLSDGL
jgi:diadenosine tetraphosphatase ApaH/serine/threonine PP2A family protein phosphatase